MTGALPLIGAVPAPSAAGSSSSSGMIVDVQTHLMVPRWAHVLAENGLISTAGAPGSGAGQQGPLALRYRGVVIPNNTSRDMHDLQLQMEVGRNAGVTHRMLSLPLIMTPLMELGLNSVDIAKTTNDFFAGVAQQYPDVRPYGTVRPHDGAAAVREAERCIDELGFKAITIDTSYGVTSRVFSHAPETYEFWEFANARGVPVFLHPALLCYGWEWMDRYRFDETVARPNETGLCVAYIIMSGMLDRYPKLKIILTHMGGSLPMLLPRLDFGHRMGYEGMHRWQRARLDLKPSEYVRRNIWADTMGFSATGARSTIDTFGIDHVVLGTDYGPIPYSPQEHIDIVRNELSLAPADQEKILGQNARALFGL